MVFSGDVLLEQGTVPGEHLPSLLGLRASTNGKPPRLPQIVRSSNLVIYVAGLDLIYLRHVQLLPDLVLLHDYSIHVVSRPAHSL